MSNDTHSLIATEEDAGQRIDRWLAEHLNLTRSGLQKLLGEGMISVNGRIATKNHRLIAGDQILVSIPAPRSLEVLPQNLPIEIVYEDEDLLVVNKPKGMVVHPAPGNEDGTLVNALLYHCQGRLSSINGVIRPGIVHRIDKDTSGLLMVAKNDSAHLCLAEQIKEHSFTRIYHAVVYGHPQKEGSVRAPIGRSPNDRKKMCVIARNSKPAVTHYRVLEELKGFSHLELRLETGRTHQIRVHMAYIGHPVAGDPVYGPRKVIECLHGQCLHAKTVGFRHPRTGEYMEFTSELPPYFLQFLQALRSKDS